jgi:hypothetical protein
MRSADRVVHGTMAVEARHLAAAFGLGRAAFGLGYVLAPHRGARGWVGEEEARRGGTQLAFRSLGARDLALGAGAAFAALSGDGRSATPWLAAHTAADLADTAGSITATGIPERGRRLGVAVASASALASAGLAVACALRG